MALPFRSVRLRVRAMTAGIADDALIESVLLTTISEIWLSWHWSFTEGSSVLQTVGPHSEGTITRTTPTLVQGTGTAFTVNDVGRELIVGNANARYVIQDVNVTMQQLTLRDAYAGDAFTASSYRIQQSRYPLAADFDTGFQAVWWRRLVEISLPMMDRADGRRSFSSTMPFGFRFAGLDATGRQMVELAWVPSDAIGIFYHYRTKPPTFDEDTLVPLRDDLVIYQTAANALSIKAVEMAEKAPQAAQIYVERSNTYMTLALKSLSEAQYSDLQRTSPAQQVRDIEAPFYYSDDYIVQHDQWSPI
jgi:hypothetical protein